MSNFRLAFKTTSAMRCTLRSWANGVFKAKPLHGLGGPVAEIAAYDASLV